MNYLKNTEDYMICFGEEIGKGLYCFGKFASTVFYNASGMAIVKKGLDAYSAAKIDIILDEINYEHKKLSKETLKAFYENLNEQNLEYLYSIFEKSKTSTYRIHIKILARLSLNLIKNKTLNYYESSLLANIQFLNEDDFMIFYKVITDENKEQLKSGEYLYRTENLNEIISLKKFSDQGMIYEKGSDYLLSEKQKRFQYLLTDYTLELSDILSEIKSE